MPRRLVKRGDERRIHPEHRESVRDILVRPNAPAAQDDMDLPDFRFQWPLGTYGGFLAVTVRADRRVNFRFENNHAAEVDDLDYLQASHAHAHARPAPSRCVHPPPVPRTPRTDRHRGREGPFGIANTLSMLLNSRLGISPEMAIHLSVAFGGNPETWLTQQMQ